LKKNLALGTILLLLAFLPPHMTSAQTLFLAFPLPNRAPDTVVINSVFDHSMVQPYCSDDIVTAYTGEVGRREFGASAFSVNFRCGTLQGFKNSSDTGFTVNGHYSGAGASGYLFYDGHPGYDYKTDLSP
jgi:Zn-dependent M28 family amino/carboxypeptidase